MRRRFTEPGLAVSALVHAGVLVSILVAFTAPEKLEEQQETVPVEVITDNQFNQIMKGDKSAKAVHPEAVPQAEKVATVEEPKPTEPLPDQTRDVTPPPPPPPPPPPQAVQPPPEPPPPLPPERPVTPPPPQEATPTPPPPPPVPTPPIRDVTAEPAIPKPPPKPPEPKPPAPPMPPVVKRPPPPPKVHEVHLPPPPKPRPVERPKPDEIAKAIDKAAEEAPPAPPTPPAPKHAIRPAKPTPEPADDSPSLEKQIQNLLQSHDAPAQRPSTNHDTSRVASLGSPTASAPKMSPSFWAGLDGLLEDQYRGCWSYLGLAGGAKYIPQVRVVYGVDGSLQGEPTLINPPSDPALRSLADSALRAVRRCNPLRIPDQYAPYYQEWKGRVLRFDPEEMAG